MALIRPFVPARDLAVSQSFYEAIGFEAGYAGDDLIVFEFEGAGFLLQRFYDKGPAENLMFQLFVTGVDAWWERTDGLVERFGVRAPIAPADKPDWGLRVGMLFDPSGVLWQVSERLAR